MAEPNFQNRPFAAALQSIIEQLEGAARQRGRIMQETVAGVQRELAALRNDLIAYLRTSGNSPESNRRHALERINVALSLIASAEYPVTSVRGSLLEQARDILKQVLEVTD